MEFETFIEEVGPELADRWAGKFTRKMISDWHYHLRSFTIGEASDLIARFFREYESRGNPRPSEFGMWLKHKGAHTTQEHAVERFEVDARYWPRPSMFQMVDERYEAMERPKPKGKEAKPIIRFGWIERRPYVDRGYVWIRPANYGFWIQQAFSPAFLRTEPTSIKLIGEAPRSWPSHSGQKTPERLEELLAKEEGFVVMGEEKFP